MRQLKNWKHLKQAILVLLGLAGFALIVILVNYGRLSIDYHKHKKDYKDAFPIYGNTNDYVPQALAFAEEKKIVLQTAYHAKGNVSRIYVIDYETGLLIKSLKLRNQEKKNQYGHVGGIATNGEKVWITNDYMVSEYSLEEILNTDQPFIVSQKDEELPIRGDFCTYHDHKLWIGEFYLKPFYDVLQEYPLLMAYSIEEEDYSYAKPDVVIALPKMVQGLTFSPDGEFVMARSFTYLIRSSLDVYQNVLEKKADETIKVGNKKIPYYHFTEKNLVKEIKLPSMAEGLFYYDGYYYILFESSSSHYSLAYPKVNSVIKYKIDKK